MDAFHSAIRNSMDTNVRNEQLAMTTLLESKADQRAALQAECADRGHLFSDRVCHGLRTCLACDAQVRA